MAFLADSSASGSRLRFSGSPLLAHSIRQVAEDLPHPTDENRTLWDATTDDGKLFGEDRLSVSSAASEMDVMEQLLADDVGVSPLGSGSDYTVFLQRIGVSSFLDPLPPRLASELWESRFLARMGPLERRCTIRCTTITQSSTLNVGKSYTETQDSIVISP